MGKIAASIIFLSEGSPVDIDSTILLQVIIFFILLFLLTFLLYRPLLNIIDERIARTEGAKQEAQRLLDSADSMTREYDSKMKKHRKESETFTAELRQKVKTDEEEILEKTKDESGKMIDEARVHIKNLEQSMRKELTPQVEEIAKLLSDKVLKGKIE